MAALAFVFVFIAILLGVVGFFSYKAGYLDGAITFIKTYFDINISTTSTTTLNTTSSPNNVYALVDDVEFVQNTYSFAPVAATYENCNSVIQCSNYLFNDRTKAGANYIPSTKKCELLTSITPFGNNQDVNNTVLITKTSSNRQNGVSSWSKNDTVTADGDMYCSPTLAFRSYANSLCGAIPFCKAYTYELNDDGTPYGCLKVNNATKSNASRSISYYSGTRRDAVDFPSTVQMTFQTYVQSGDLMSTFPQMDIMACALKVKDASVTASWSYSPNGGGQCQIYSNTTTPPVLDKSSTGIVLTYKSN